MRLFGGGANRMGGNFGSRSGDASEIVIPGRSRDGGNPFAVSQPGGASSNANPSSSSQSGSVPGIVRRQNGH